MSKTMEAVQQKDQPTSPQAAQAVMNLQREKDMARAGRSLWMEAWLRLRRNRPAVVGIVIIILYILMAIFAPLLAPRGFAAQVLEDNNAAPIWVTKIFSNMDLMDYDEWTFEAEKDDWFTILMRSEQDWGVTVHLHDPEGNLSLVEKTGSLQYEKYHTTLKAETSGTYKFNVMSKTVNTGGPYELLVIRTPPFPCFGNHIICQQSEASYLSTLISSAQGTTSIGPVEGTQEGTEIEYGQSLISQLDSDGYVNYSPDYPLGADIVGRDMLSRIIWGARISLAVAFVGPMVSLMVGLAFGLISGYFGGRTDNIMMRFVDIMYAFPTILLIILLMAFFRSGFAESDKGSFAYALNEIDKRFGGMLFIFIGIGITSWMGVSRLARGQVLSVREMEYITAARSIGTSGRAIIVRHILPNILGPIVVAETLTIPGYISLEAFLSFIGLGVNRPTPSWGSMIAQGAASIGSYPNQAIFPALALFFIMFAFNFLGDGLRDALDPRTKKEG